MNRITAQMTIARLGLEADDLLMGLVTFRPDEEGGWYCFCSDPPEPKTTQGRTAREAFARLIKWVAARRKVYR